MEIEDFRKQVKDCIAGDTFYCEESQEIIVEDLCDTYFKNSGYDEDYCSEIEPSHFLQCIEETYTELTPDQFEAMKKKYEDDENAKDSYEDSLDEIWNLDNGSKLVKHCFQQ